jgi:putative transposase
LLLKQIRQIHDCYDNAMMEPFRGTLQLELLGSKTWQTRDGLPNAIFEWTECWYNPDRHHSSIGMHSPVTFETLHTGLVLQPLFVILRRGGPGRRAATA